MYKVLIRFFRIVLLVLSMNEAHAQLPLPSGIDLSDPSGKATEIRNGRIENLPALPSISGATGRLIYLQSDGSLYLWAGSAWKHLVCERDSPTFGNVHSSTLTLEHESGVFRLFNDGTHSRIQTNQDIYLDPTDGGTAGGKIVPATTMEFPDFLGDKIRFFSHAYSIGVSAFDLDITSDKNIKFHSDTVPDLMTILGDNGDVAIKRDLTIGRNFKVGGAYMFASDTEGDKLYLFGNLYKVSVSPSSLDTYSDRYFKWHVDSASNVLVLDGNSGRLQLSGPLKLPVYTTLPASGSVGDVIYYDDQEDDRLDGMYFWNALAWAKTMTE